MTRRNSRRPTGSSVGFRDGSAAPSTHLERSPDLTATRAVFGPARDLALGTSRVLDARPG